MINVRNLRTECGDFVAVAGSTVSIEAAEVFRVSQDGAGKTTTLGPLAGLAVLVAAWFVARVSTEFI